MSQHHGQFWSTVVVFCALRHYRRHFKCTHFWFYLQIKFLLKLFTSCLIVWPRVATGVAVFLGVSDLSPLISKHGRQHSLNIRKSDFSSQKQQHNVNLLNTSKMMCSMLCVFVCVIPSSRFPSFPLSPSESLGSSRGGDLSQPLGVCVCVSAVTAAPDRPHSCLLDTHTHMLNPTPPLLTVPLILSPFLC